MRDKRNDCFGDWLYHPAVAKLVAKWREGDRYSRYADDAKKMCADELEAVATAPPEQAALEQPDQYDKPQPPTTTTIVPQPASAGALSADLAKNIRKLLGVNDYWEKELIAMLAAHDQKVRQAVLEGLEKLRQSWDDLADGPSHNFDFRCGLQRCEAELGLFLKSLASRAEEKEAK